MYAKGLSYVQIEQENPNQELKRTDERNPKFQIGRQTSKKRHRSRPKCEHVSLPHCISNWAETTLRGDNLNKPSKRVTRSQDSNS